MIIFLHCYNSEQTWLRGVFVLNFTADLGIGIHIDITLHSFQQTQIILVFKILLMFSLNSRGNIQKGQDI